MVLYIMIRIFVFFQSHKSNGDHDILDVDPIHITCIFE